jgi:hypothetical protein
MTAIARRARETRGPIHVGVRMDPRLREDDEERKAVTQMAAPNFVVLASARAI